MQQPYSPIAPLFLNSLSARFSAMRATLGGKPNVGPLGSGTWPLANLALYIPLTLPFAYPVERVFWANGTTAVGNVDMGIYSAQGARLFSTGSTAQAGTSDLQYVTAKILLDPGEYYLALALSSTSGSTWRTSGIDTKLARLAGCQEQTSAFALPSSMSAVVTARSYWPLFGITRTATGF